MRRERELEDLIGCWTLNEADPGQPVTRDQRTQRRFYVRACEGLLSISVPGRHPVLRTLAAVAA